MTKITQGEQLSMRVSVDDSMGSLVAWYSRDLSAVDALGLPIESYTYVRDLVVGLDIAQGSEVQPPTDLPYNTMVMRTQHSEALGNLDLVLIKEFWGTPMPPTYYYEVSTPIDEGFTADRYNLTYRDRQNWHIDMGT